MCVGLEYTDKTMYSVDTEEVYDHNLSEGMQFNGVFIDDIQKFQSKHGSELKEVFTLNANHRQSISMEYPPETHNRYITEGNLVLLSDMNGTKYLAVIQSISQQDKNNQQISLNLIHMYTRPDDFYPNVETADVKDVQSLVHHTEPMVLQDRNFGVDVKNYDFELGTFCVISDNYLAELLEIPELLTVFNI